jgi:hypothetical protein
MNRHMYRGLMSYPRKLAAVTIRMAAFLSSVCYHALQNCGAL